MQSYKGSILFRYRTVTDYSIKELLSDDIVISSLDTFNDPCDTKFGFESIDYFKEITAFNKASEAFGDILGAEYFNKPQQKHFLKLYYDSQFSNIIKNFKKHLLVGCFTYEPVNPVMWSHYSDNRCGFVLAYDTNSINTLLNNKDEENNSLFEVEYNDKTFMVTDDIKDCINSFTKIEIGQINIDMNSAQNMFEQRMLTKPQEYQEAFATKSEEWKYEHEVRFVKYDQSLKGESHISIGKSAPKYIILGDKMSKKDRYLLLSIAKNKRIDVYELCPSFNNSQFGLLLNKVPTESVEYYLKNGYYNFELDSFDEPLKR